MEKPKGVQVRHNCPMRLHSFKTLASPKALVFARSAVGLFVLIFASLCFAAAEFLPEATTQNEKEELIKQLGSLAPFIREQATLDVISTQQASLSALRAQFKDFDKWSESKPDPITIYISKSEVVTKKVAVMAPAALQALRQQVQENLTRLKKIKTINKKESLKDQFILNLATEIETNIQTGSEGARGIIVGLIQALPQERRGEVFKTADPQMQLQMIRESGLTDEQLRASSFRAESVGLSKDELTLNKVVSIAEERRTASQKTVGLLATLKYLQLLSENDFASFISERGSADKSADPTAAKNSVARILTDVEMNFLASNDSPFFLELYELLARQNSKKIPLIQKSLASLVSQIPKSAFEIEQRKVNAEVPYLRVVEVHPYLGYFRGCVGGDCSTSHSAMFPFSPWEHVFYIVDKNDAFIGYVSATRVHMKGDPTLYLKDISGPTLSAKDAELVLNSFHRVHGYYGTKKFAIAAPSFTNVQNHFPVLTAMLSDYNSDMPLVKVDFDDAQVRSAIANNHQVFKTLGAYDSIQTHATAGFFKPNKEVLAKYKIHYELGTLTPFKPKTSKQALLFALDLLAGNPKASLKEISGLDETEVKAIYRALQNQTANNLETYYELLKKSFTKYEIELSRSFRQDHAPLFVSGHLRAKDAFSIKSDALRGDSEKYFINLVRQHGDLNQIRETIQRWTEALNESKRFQDLIVLLAERAEPRDLLYLITFADLGISAAKNELKKPALRNKKELAIAVYLENSILRNLEASVSNKKNQSSDLQRFAQLLSQSETLSGAELLHAADSLLTSFGISLRNLSEPRLLKLLERAQLETTDAFEGSNRQKNLVILNQVMDSNEIALALRIVLKHSAQLTKTDSVEKLVNKLTLSPSTLNLLALYGLGIQGVKGAQRAIVTEPFQQSLITNLASFSQMNSTQTSQVKGAKFEGSAEALYQWLTKQKIVQPSNDIFAIFENQLLRAIRGDVSAFEEMSKTLKPFQITLNMLLDSPEMRGHLTESARNYASLFETKNEPIFDFATTLLKQNIISGEDYEELLTFLVRQLGSTPHHRLLNKFALDLILAFESKKCEACYLVLERVLPYGILQDTKALSSTILKRLLQSEGVYAKTLAIQELLDRGTPNLKISDKHLEGVARALDNESNSRTPDPLLRWSEVALNILMQYKSSSEVVQKELKETMKSEEDMHLVIKAAIAFLRNGGDPERVKKEVRRAEKDLKISRTETPELIALWNQYDAVLANPKTRITFNFNKIQSCQKLLM